jgi:RimJ/RimL family protein N-acetyltransferase
MTAGDAHYHQIAVAARTELACHPHGSSAFCVARSADQEEDNAMPDARLGPTLETERLILRPPSAQDFDAWAAMAADADVMRFIGGAQSRPIAWRTMCAFTGAWIVTGFSFFSLVEKATGRWIGRAGPWRPVGWPGSEIGWALDRSAWGQGYATEAAARCIDWAFDALGWQEVIHTIDPDNTASIALALRLGSRRRGPAQLPAPFETKVVDLYGQDRAAWRGRAHSATR